MAQLEVLALDTVTPRIRAPGVGDSYTLPRRANFDDGVSISGMRDTWVSPEPDGVTNRRGILFDFDETSPDTFGISSPFEVKGTYRATASNFILTNTVNVQTELVAAVATPQFPEVSAGRFGVSRTDPTDVGDNGFLTGLNFAVNQDATSSTVTTEGVGFGGTQKYENGTVTTAYNVNLFTQFGTSSGRSCTSTDFVLGVRVASELGGGAAGSTITNLYGMLLEKPTVDAGTITITNRFGIVQQDDEAQNVIRGTLVLADLPTSDPAIAGALWVDVADGRTVKQSAG